MTTKRYGKWTLIYINNHVDLYLDNADGLLPRFQAKRLFLGTHTRTQAADVVRRFRRTLRAHAAATS